MLLTEEQTKYYLTDMINHYGEKQNKQRAYHGLEVKQSIRRKHLKI